MRCYWYCRKRRRWLSEACDHTRCVRRGHFPNRTVLGLVSILTARLASIRGRV